MTYSEFLVDITEPTMGVIRAGPWYNMVRSNYLYSDTCCHFEYLFPYDYDMVYFKYTRDILRLIYDYFYVTCFFLCLVVFVLHYGQL